MTLTIREADAAFADLICADPQWLDAESGALIAACFGGPPGPPPPAPPGSRRAPAARRRPPGGPSLARPPRRSRLPGRSMAGSARPRRICPAPGPPPLNPLGAAARTTATSTGHRPAVLEGR